MKENPDRFKAFFRDYHNFMLRQFYGIFYLKAHDIAELFQPTEHLSSEYLDNSRV